MPQHHDLEVVHVTGVEGARRARGAVVVIDVLRSFTVSAYALAGGALECRLVPTVAQAVELAKQTPGAMLCAEEGALPIEGIEISNSPTQIRALDLAGRVLVQRSSAGTPVVAAAMENVVEVGAMFAASLVVARATVQACLLTKPRVLTLVASADFPEDHACARYMEGIVRGRPVDLAKLLQPLYDSDRYRKVSGGEWPGFPPTDLELSLTPDRFDFAMPVARVAGFDRLTRSDRA